MEQISIGIYHYQGALKSAVYGLEEMFLIANSLCNTQNVPIRFQVTVFEEPESFSQPFTVILLPPSWQSDQAALPDPDHVAWLKTQHQKGARIASACAGAFLLAATSLVDTRSVTTHWGLSDRFHAQFPHIELKCDEILIDHGDVITAGGVMSWLDLGFELIKQYASPVVMRHLGKLLVVDTAHREQRFYQQFMPSFLHGDQAIVTIQQRMNLEYMTAISIQTLAEQSSLTVRTMQRRFLKATGYNPNQYLQRLRVQKMCDLLESTTQSFEAIATSVGYEDISACRKAFVKTMGLTPREFRRRFI